MSTSKVKKLKTQLYFTATWLANVLTITTASAHNLVTGDLVTIIPDSAMNASLNKQAVTVTNATTFTIASTHPTAHLRGLVEIDFFRTGFTGRIIFTAPKSTGSPSVVQSFVTGTGGATYLMEASLDGIHWTPLTGVDVVHGALSGDTQATTVAANWTYLATNISVIGASTKFEVMYSA